MLTKHIFFPDSLALNEQPRDTTGCNISPRHEQWRAQTFWGAGAQ